MPGKGNPPRSPELPDSSLIRAGSRGSRPGSAAGSPAPGVGSLPPHPGDPHFRPEPPGLIAGTLPLGGERRGGHRGPGCAAPRGPVSIVSSDCGGLGNSEKRLWAPSSAPRPSPGFKPGLGRRNRENWPGPAAASLIAHRPSWWGAQTRLPGVLG